MLRNFWRIFKSDIEKSVCRVEDHLRSHLKPRKFSKLWIHHFGATYIHPRHLVICIAVRTDAEAQQLESDQLLEPLIRHWLSKEDYPDDGIRSVKIRIDSQETVDRDWKGNWNHYYK